jgi:hypothetical protein
MEAFGLVTTLILAALQLDPTAAQTPAATTTAATAAPTTSNFIFNPHYNLVIKYTYIVHIKTTCMFSSIQKLR